MPWSSNERLPSRVKKFAPTSNKKRAFRHAFESAKEQGHDESSQWAIATAASKRAGKKGKKNKSFREFYNEYHKIWQETGALE